MVGDREPLLPDPMVDLLVGPVDPARTHLLGQAALLGGHHDQRIPLAGAAAVGQQPHEVLRVRLRQQVGIVDEHQAVAGAVTTSSVVFVVLP